MVVELKTGHVQTSHPWTAHAYHLNLLNFCHVLSSPREMGSSTACGVNPEIVRDWQGDICFCLERYQGN